jgi:hypothetical protein
LQGFFAELFSTTKKFLCLLFSLPVSELMTYNTCAVGLLSNGVFALPVVSFLTAALCVYG